MTSRYMATMDVSDLVEKKKDNNTKSKTLFETPTTILMIIFIAMIANYSVQLGFFILVIFAVSVYCYIICNPEIDE
jgi:hypothetical protein